MSIICLLVLVILGSDWVLKTCFPWRNNTHHHSSISTNCWRLLFSWWKNSKNILKFCLNAVFWLQINGFLHHIKIKRFKSNHLIQTEATGILHEYTGILLSFNEIQQYNFWHHSWRYILLNNLYVIQWLEFYRRNLTYRQAPPYKNHDV